MDLKEGGDAGLSHICILNGVDPKHSNFLTLTFERQSNASIIVNIPNTSHHFRMTKSLTEDEAPRTFS